MIADMVYSSKIAQIWLPNVIPHLVPTYNEISSNLPILDDLSYNCRHDSTISVINFHHQLHQIDLNTIIVPTTTQQHPFLTKIGSNKHKTFHFPKTPTITSQTLISEPNKNI